MEGPQTRRARAILLGASNIAMGLRSAIGAARERLGPELDLFVACGRGRSYGVPGNFLGRSLPGIGECGLWRALEPRDRSSPTFAIVTDIGNDLGFGSSAAQLESWLSRTLERLAVHDARVVVTGLPIQRLLALPAWEFTFFASLFFPTRRVVRERVIAEAIELEERLGALARAGRFVKVDPDPAWYGHDPIHVTKSSRPASWRAYTGGWKGTPELAAAPRPPELSGWLWYEQARMFGLELGREQPCARSRDGTRIHLY